VPAYRGCPGKRPLNGCSSSSSSTTTVIVELSNCDIDCIVQCQLER